MTTFSTTKLADLAVPSAGPVADDAMVLAPDMDLPTAVRRALDRVTGRRMDDIVLVGAEAVLVVSVERMLHQLLEERVGGEYELRQALQGQLLAAHASVTARGRLSEQAQLLDSVLAAAPIVLFSLDADGRFVSSVGAGLDDLGLQPGEVVGSLASEMFADIPDVVRDLGRALTGETFRSVTAVAGRLHETSYTPMTGPAGELRGVVGVSSDVTEREQMQQRLQRLAYIDEVAGIRNRASFSEDLADLVAKDGSFIFMVMDLDGFAALNDRHGHALGDLVLAEVGRRLQGIAGERDCFRLGSDDFAVLLDHGDETLAGDMALKAVEAVAAPMDLGGVAVVVAPRMAIVPVGVGTCTATIREMGRHADTLMRSMKRDGDDRIGSFDEAMLAELVHSDGQEEELQRCLDNDDVIVHYQPKFDLGTGEVVGAEALVRFRDIDGRPMPPAGFIEIAERLGLVGEVGRRVLDAALDEAVAWQTIAGRPLDIAVNVSPWQLQHTDVPAIVARSLQRCGLPATQLQIEVTESLVVEDLAVARRVLGGLRELGCSWPSTTSAPGTHRWPTCRSCRSTSSRSTGPSSTASTVMR